jgi:hypothetical protein
MTTERTRIHSRRILVAAGAALALIGISGCAAGTVRTGPTSSAKPSITTTPPTADPTASAAAIDKVTCETYSDMLTIMHNADYSFHHEAIGDQERTGWYDLAFRVIGRAPSGGEGPVAKALATMKGIQPPLGGDSTDPTVIAWGDASQALADACKAEGLPYWARGFVGG